MCAQIEFTGWAGVALSVWGVVSLVLIWRYWRDAETYKDAFLSVSLERSQIEQAMANLEALHHEISDRTEDEWKKAVEDLTAEWRKRYDALKAKSQ